MSREEESEQLLVEVLSTKLLNRLAERRIQKGKGGWYSCSPEYLEDLGNRTADPLDRIAYLSMAYVRSLM